MGKKKISFVIPAYNEVTNIDEIYMRLLTQIETLANYQFEIVFVDDGSEDGTFEKLKFLSVQDSRVKYVSLSRNFGHQSALTAGLDSVHADAIISMDCDLQHPPEAIPELIHWWEKGYDIVYTYRKSTEDASFFKRITASIFYKLINTISEIKIDPNTSDFRLLDKQVVMALVQFKGDRFYRGLVKWVGFKQKKIEYNAVSRFSGEGKYTFKKMLRLAMYGFLSYSKLPLYSVIALCFLFIFLSIAYGLFALYLKFITKTAIPGQSSILLTNLIIAAVQLYAFAILSIYVLKNFQETRKRPIYIIKEKKI